MSQTTAALRDCVEGRLGLLAEPFGPCDVRSGSNETLPLYFGRMAVQDGTEEGHVKMPDAGGQLPVGVVVASHHATSNTGTPVEPHVGPTGCAGLLRKGYIWVEITTDVAIGDAVHFLSGAGDEGKFANAGGDAVAAAGWVKPALAADGFALLELNLV